MLDYRWSHNPLTYRGTVTSNWYWSHTVPKVGSQSSRITDECHNTRLEGCLCYTPIGKDVIWEASPSIWGASLLHTNTWRRKKFPFCATIQIYKACSQFFFFFIYHLSLALNSILLFSSVNLVTILHRCCSVGLEWLYFAKFFACVLFHWSVQFGSFVNSIPKIKKWHKTADVVIIPICTICFKRCT